MKKLLLCPLILTLCHCGVFEAQGTDSTTNTTSNGSSSGDSEESRDRNADETLALALGGVGAGMDEIQVTEETQGQVIGFEAADPSLVDFKPLTGFNSYDEGGGGRVIPSDVGITEVWYTLAGKRQTVYEATIPPQSLIQILIGEARGPLSREVNLLADGVIDLASVSPTGDAVGAVIRNRISLIDEAASPGLFAANRTRYNAEAASSKYDAVIEASSSSGVYQFNPVDTKDPTHEKYVAAARRDNLDQFEEDLFPAYDQAVLTAADVYNENLEDPTNGAFAFYSPSDSQYTVLKEALEGGAKTLPSGAGTSDAQFPAYKPIQVLILPGVATKTEDSEIPSFVFVRPRESSDPAVTAVP